MGFGLIDALLAPFRGRRPKAETSPPPVRSQIRQLPPSVMAAIEAARARDDLWQLADFKDADATLSPTVRRALRAIARYELQNNDMVFRVVETYADDLVGEDGPTLQLDSGDPTVDRMIEADWADYWRAQNLSAKLRTAVVAESGGDGEACAEIRFTETWPIPVALESDRLASPQWGAWIKSDYIDGVHIDTHTNEPVAYDVLLAHPGTQYLDKIGLQLKADTIPAPLFLHAFRERRAEQHRGFPRIASAVINAGHGRKYFEGTCTREANRSSFWILLQSQAGGGGDEDQGNDEDWWQDIKLPGKTGLGMILPEGMEPVSLKDDASPSQPTEIHKIVAGKVAGCFKMPLSRALGYDTGGGYSGVRDQLTPYHNGIQADRSQVWAPLWMSKLYAVWLLVFKARHPEIDWTKVRPDRHEWLWPGEKLVVDPSRESAAQETRLGIGEETRESLTECPDLDARDARAAAHFGVTVEEYRRAIFNRVFGPQQAKVPANDTLPV
ncbi:phage portal protein [Planctomyces sp. SH-PL14]|uniref:phage portal protein n=1 Tax=Planctomyces sp. SH-PL14 TaxID=1632864 RepID=UPI00078BED53|nr:phage portal protein [Planctomyces sp. SH-PL14]AMV18252.1 Phage portal protein, lambda family [Planctomyces sp. SH-PL14]